MNNPSLPDLVEALRAALKASGCQVTDARTRALLTTLHSEISACLAATINKGPAQESTIGHLEEIALRFEAEHPAVGTAIREAINTLVKAGV
jgi:Domain of unknown function (DUF4404)